MPAAALLGIALATLLAAPGARGQDPGTRKQEWFVDVSGLC